MIIDFMFITGMVLGIELLEDEEAYVLSIDLLIFRIMFEKLK